MQLADRIEARRFVGREFLLWLWVESELFDATLRTEARRTRDAKEALLRGQLPESAGLRITLGDRVSRH